MTDTENPAAIEPVKGAIVQAGGALQAMYDFVGTLPSESTEDIQERIIRQVLQATTLDEINKAGQSVPAVDVLNIPIVVREIRPDESSFQDGLRWYLHVVGELENGDPITVSVGSQDVFVKLVRAAMLDLLPIRLTMWRAERATRDGFYPVFGRVEPVGF